jgi:hypothetical protein
MDGYERSGLTYITFFPFDHFTILELNSFCVNLLPP